MNAYQDDENEYNSFLLRLNSASIFLHFSYEDDNGYVNSWYDFANSLQLITRKMLKEYVRDARKSVKNNLTI